jgi:hypothetical protein
MENTLMVALAEPKTWPKTTQQTSSPRRSHPRPLRTPYPRSTYATSGLRFYFPEISRWLSRDPIGERGGVNLYGFVRNHPLGRVDILGLTGDFIMDFHDYFEEECCGEETFKEIAEMIQPWVPNAIQKKFAGAPDWVHVFSMDEGFASHDDIHDCFIEWMDKEHSDLYLATLDNKTLIGAYINPKAGAGVVLMGAGGYLIKRGASTGNPYAATAGAVLVAAGAVTEIMGIKQGVEDARLLGKQTTLYTLYNLLENNSSISEVKEYIEDAGRIRMLLPVEGYLTEELVPLNTLLQQPRGRVLPTDMDDL